MYNFSKILNKVVNIIKKSFVTLTTDDSGDYSKSQISYYDKTTYVQTAYPYGMNANAPVNTLVLTMNIMGQEENLIGMPYTARERFKNLKPGEVAFGSPLTGSYIKFLSNGDIEIFSKSNIKITSENDCIINSKDINFIGKVNLGNGGSPIARKGDQVQVGSEIGEIIQGSTNNTSN